MSQKSNESGFTLIEVLVVIIIIGALASVVGLNLFSHVDKSKQVAAQSQIEIFSLALSNYRLDVGDYPSTSQGLKALIERPTEHPIPKNWNGPYLEKDIPTDPWGNPYIYSYDASSSRFRIISYGKDGKEGGEGADRDITN